MKIDVIVKIKSFFNVWMGVLNAEHPGQRSEVRAQSSEYASRFTLNAQRSSGIALVMVLGILSVMVIMAVAFAIAMRTERVAAGNYADSVRARQLVQVGLARALDDLAGKLGTNGLMSAAGGTNYPPWIATNSYTNNYINTSTNVNLLTLLALGRENEATNFVPRALWAAATNADYSNPSNHWLPLDSLVYTNNGGTPYLAESNRMGRVKYLILNCSGLLDANFAGSNGSIRGVGVSPSELAIGNMPEMNNSFAKRAEHFRYETQAELAELSAAFNGAPSNFTVYSRALPGCWRDSLNQSQVNLAGSAGNLTNRQSFIINAFTNAKFSLTDAGILYSNLIEYVDGDTIPSNWTTCVESVPMINEISISSMEVPAGSGIVENQVRVELWYPFVAFNSDNFNLKLEYTVKGADNVVNTYPLIISNQASLNAGEVRSLSFLPSLGQTTNASYTFGLTALEVQNTNMVLDKILSFPPPITITLNTQSNAECIDPRFNANLNDALQWTTFSSAQSMGLTNQAAINYWSSNCDKDGAMHVANQPLRSAGELGYLAYGTWKTVKLYGPNLHRVLDFFAVGTNTTDSLVTNTIWRGRVNPNSKESNALAIVFADMPVEEYQNPVTVKRVNPADAYVLYGRLTNAIAFQSGFTNLADIGYALTNYNSLSSSLLVFDTEIKREGLIRNTCGLLNVRQNLFTIIIEAQVASGGNIPRNPVKQRAAALVWRDPYTGEMFVRSLKWLKD